MKVLQDTDPNHHISEGIKECEYIDFSDWNDLNRNFFAYYVLKNDYDIFHLQFLQYRFYSQMWFPISLIKIPLLFLNLSFLKMFGVHVVWTAHHSRSHETPYPKLDHLARQGVISLCDHIFVLEPPVKSQLKQHFNVRTNITVARLGNYREFHNQRDSGEPLNRQLPKESPVMSMLGHLREYKRVPLGIRSADESDQIKSAVVAGRPKTQQVEDEIRDSIRRASIPVFKQFGFVSDTDILRYVDASDVVLILNNQDTVPATAYLAISSKTPIVTVPGGVKEYLVKEYGVGVVADSDSIHDIANAIDCAIDKPLEPDWERFDIEHQWDQYLESHLEVYKKLAN